MPNHVIVSTLCWSEQPLEVAIASIAALDFGQADLAVHEGWAHLNPSDLAGGGADAIRREADRITELIREHQMKRVSAINAGIAVTTLSEQQRQLAAVCDLARALDVPVICLNAARRGTPVSEEVARLKALVPVAAGRGVQLTIETHVGCITEQPAVAAQLCEAVPGLGLTLDASHYYAGPNQGADFSVVLPHVRHVHLRDAARSPDRLLVTAGTGQVDFQMIVSRLHALGYAGKFAIEYIDRMLARSALPKEGEPRVIPEHIIRMRDVFLAAERAAGIVRTPPGT